MSDVTTWQTWSVLRIPDQRPRPANKLPPDESRAAAKRTTGAGAVDDQAAHVAHFTAAVYRYCWRCGMVPAAISQMPADWTNLVWAPLAFTFWSVSLK